MEDTYMVELDIGNFYTVDLQNLCNKNGKFIKKIRLINDDPEEYICFDGYGNPLVHIIVGEDATRCYCPDSGDHSSLVSLIKHETGLTQYSTAERFKCFEMMFNDTNIWYGYLIRTVLVKETDGKTVYINQNDPNVTEQTQLGLLYKYQQSNLLPETIIRMRQRGLSYSYDEIIEKIDQLENCGTINQYDKCNVLNILKQIFYK